MLDNKEKHTIEDMMAIQGDFVSLAFRDLKPYIQEMRADLDKKSGKDSMDLTTIYWLTRLLTWNGNTSSDSYEASVFEIWYRL